MSGLFIVLEGLGGLGKTSLALGLAEKLTELGYDVVATYEPGGTPGANYIRNVVRSKELDKHTDTPFSGLGLAMMFMASRADHLEKVILPALKQNKIVICDRYCDSTFAIQHAYNNVPISDLVKLHDAAGFIYPDVTFYLDGSVELAESRMSKEEKLSDQFDSVSLKVKNKIIGVYKEFSFMPVFQPDQSPNVRTQRGWWVNLDAALPKADLVGITANEIIKQATHRGILDFNKARDALADFNPAEDTELLEMISKANVDHEDLVGILKNHFKSN